MCRVSRYDDAAESYKKGLDLAPEDASLREGLRKAMDAKYAVPTWQPRREFQVPKALAP